VCTIYFVDVGSFNGGMPPPPLSDGGDVEMGEAHPQVAWASGAIGLVCNFGWTIATNWPEFWFGRKSTLRGLEISAQI